MSSPYSFIRVTSRGGRSFFQGVGGEFVTKGLIEENIFLKGGGIVLTSPSL